MTLSTTELDALVSIEARQTIPAESFIPVLSNPPFVPSRSLFNIRDIGAVPGSAVPAGRMYRCGALDYASKDPEAQAWLAANVRRIFDLRKSGPERDLAPDPVIPGVENVWLPGDGTYPTPDLADFAKNGGRDAWKVQYLNVARIYQPMFRAVLHHIRDRPTEPFLFHCTGKVDALLVIKKDTNEEIAGRDRTGVLAGLLHHLAGTAPEDAVRDYMLSRIGIEPARDKLMQFAMGSVGITDPETPGFYNLVELKPEYWAAFLEALDEEYGGWDGYVIKCLGISEEDLSTIKKNLQS